MIYNIEKMTDNNKFEVSNLEKLKGSDQASPEDVKALKAALDNKDDLFKSFF